MKLLHAITQSPYTQAATLLAAALIYYTSPYHTQPTDPYAIEYFTELLEQMPIVSSFVDGFRQGYNT